MIAAMQAMVPGLSCWTGLQMSYFPKRPRTSVRRHRWMCLSGAGGRRWRTCCMKMSSYLVPLDRYSICSASLFARDSYSQGTGPRTFPFLDTKDVKRTRRERSTRVAWLTVSSQFVLWALTFWKLPRRRRRKRSKDFIDSLWPRVEDSLRGSRFL